MAISLGHGKIKTHFRLQKSPLCPPKKLAESVVIDKNVGRLSFLDLLLGNVMMLGLEI